MKTSYKFIASFAALVVVALAGGIYLLNDSREDKPNTVDVAPFQQAGPYQVSVVVEPDPPKVGRNHITVLVQDAQDQPVTGAEVRAIAQMPAMGSMQAMIAAADIEETAPGRYQGDFELSMSGAWPLAVDVHSEALGHGDLTFDMATGRKGLGLATATPGDISHYTCSMHPSVKSATPGTCPICAMNLVPVTKQEVQSGSILVDARRRQLIGVTTGVVERKHLRQTIRAAGQVTYDETRLTDISLKFDGWIGELTADYVGVPVRKGQTLFSVYSPELVSAQDEYLESLHRRKLDTDSLLGAARRRLSLWDIGPAQIRALEKRGRAAEYVPILSPVGGTVIEKLIVAGTAVKAGMKLLRIADLSRVWVEGQVYEYELPYVQVGMAAEVVLPEMPGRTFPSKVAYLYPYLESDTRTARVRVELPNPDGLLRPDMYAHVHLKVDLGERLVVPEGAVLYAGESRVVFLDLGEGRLQPRKIKTGLRNGDDIEVLDGLEAGDRVVTSGNFLIAAESKLKAGIDQW
ncbi:MAG TPA: efflux RND transporter periplasmic adaptor subunit [Gammaproteobacteria bacterium]|nr:efflux RND transporter periplasmic adaptor subunit [Gammaproteobacteria bacterium]